MGLFRLIFLGLIIWLIVRVVRALTAPARQGRSPRHREAADSGREARTKGQAEIPAQRMVRCAECGLHVPRGEAVCDGERCFCSAEHRDRFARH